MADKKLTIVVAAQDLASGKLNTVNKELAGMGKASTTANAGLGRMVASGNKVTGAFGRAKKSLMGFAGSTAGLVGLSLGFAGVVKFGTDAITAASNFGAQVQKVHKLTGLATGTASAMVDTLDKWGISGDRIIPILGRMQVNLGKLAPSQKKAAAFQKQFGFDILQGNGRIADANTLLLRAADYWNGNATSTQKATVMSKLFGKAWQDMIPILSKGSKFIKAQEKDALHLTDTQVKNIAKFRNAQRGVADAFGDAQVIIGAELMPALTDLMNTFGAWLSKHQDDIAKFFRTGVAFAKELGSAIQSVVVPAIDAITKAWSAIPPEIRQLLIGGFVANKALKMTIGFDPIDIARKGVSDAVGNVIGGFFGRGSPANPMFTKEVGLPGGPGGPGLPPGAAPPGGITVPAIGAGIAIERKPLTDMAHDFAQFARDNVAQGKNANFTFKSIQRESALSRGDSARALGTITSTLASKLGPIPGIGPMIVGAVNSLKPHIDAIRINASVAYLTGSAGRARPAASHPHAGNRPSIGYVDKGGGARKGGRAAGGPVWPGGTYTVGERGPERLTMGYGGGYVTPMGGGRGGGVTVNVRTYASVSAREADIAGKRWKRVTTANGNGVSIR